jgi:hypothetical protein
MAIGSPHCFVLSGLQRPVSRVVEAAWRAGLKTPEEVMEILEAVDATGSLRAAAELAGCDHKTVGYWVRARDAAGGGFPVPVRPRPRVDAFAEKIEEWVGRSRGKIRVEHLRQAAGPGPRQAAIAARRPGRHLTSTTPRR